MRGRAGAFWLALAALLLLAGGAALYVRLAPSDPARWNVDLFSPDMGNIPIGSVFVAGRSPADLLADLDRIALSTPRTVRLAGSPAEGRITWITRSAFWGFPDYTTAAAIDRGGVTELAIYARQRFGRKDFGVNAARVKDWLTRLSAS